jgi:hypothetical protein
MFNEWLRSNGLALFALIVSAFAAYNSLDNRIVVLEQKQVQSRSDELRMETSINEIKIDLKKLINDIKYQQGYVEPTKKN